MMRRRLISILSLITVLTSQFPQVHAAETITIQTVTIGEAQIVVPFDEEMKPQCILQDKQES